MTSITAIVLDWYQEVSDSYARDAWAKGIMEQFTLNPTSRPGFTLKNVVLRYQGRLVMGDHEELKEARFWRHCMALHLEAILGCRYLSEGKIDVLLA